MQTKRQIPSSRITENLIRILVHIYPGVPLATALRTLAFTSGKARSAADDLGIDLEHELKQLKHGGSR